MGTKKTLCVCNKCGAEMQIDIKEGIIDQDKDGGDIIEQFMIFPERGQRYTVFISDDFMREKVAARKRLKRKPGYSNPAIDAAIVREMQRHLRELKVKYNRE